MLLLLVSWRGRGVFLIISEIEQKFCAYLKKNSQEFVETWKQKIIVSQGDPFREEIIMNGENLLFSIISLIIGEKRLEDIQPLCAKIATERAQADVNIGEFVHNVNVGRNELFEAMCELDVKARELKPLITKIHSCFDQLIYFTVLKYSEIITKSLEEKQQFIDETHKERLTILGQMSASFVHEFRNPLTSIMGFVKLLKAENTHLPYLDIISHELDQLNFRISQFLLVSRKEMWNEKEFFSLNDLFHDITHFLYPSLVNTNVSIEKNMFYPIGLYGYRSEVRQVILNILMNSIDALEANPKNRKIVIDTFEDESTIHIIIKNNGPMIPADKIETIFEPFVTTKKLGTGIGLFVCKQIVEKHDGRISCESTPDWTRFCMTFQKKTKETTLQ
ncbi:histidine kinase N-terminal domain-containing protein [Ectobacillus panaciterrae]|uniref:histidine kinase N-terminal domain-containing protein n=1 Tax=Ectobacillus panaciterrae TaxID=363872 RepID=UPI0003FF301C|nr:histidine kinase N-terminal domain-containing protein [Ectobacillus panaciterrae]